MYEATASLPIRIKSPWKSQYSFYQSYFPYTLVGTCKSRNYRRSKSRHLAFICLMFFVSFFLLCYHYQNISFESTTTITTTGTSTSTSTSDDLVDVSSSSSSSSSLSSSTAVINTPISPATSESAAAAVSRSTSAATFSLSTLLWPRKMFASKFLTSGDDETPLRRVMSQVEEGEIQVEEQKKKQQQQDEKEKLPDHREQGPSEQEEQEEEAEIEREGEEAGAAAAAADDTEGDGGHVQVDAVREIEQVKKEEYSTALQRDTGEGAFDSHQQIKLNVPLTSSTGGKSEKRLPQVIIIGVRKCGTRALLEFLNLHSRIQKARDEVHFFDEDSKYSLGLEWYKSQMPYSYANQVTIEKTPAYFVTDLAPERIRAMNSSIRLILLVRDPVIRLISDYAQLNANKLAKKERPLRSIEQMVLSQDGSVNVNYRPVKTSIYSYYYTKWAETFPSSQIHVVDGDRLIDDPYSEVLKVIQFLNLDTREITADQFSFNVTKGFFCIKVSPSDVDKCLNETKGRRHPIVNETVVRLLRQFYAPYNRHFYSLIGRQFNWREE